MGVANGVAKGLQSVADHFEENPQLLETVTEITK
jgi:hypothetical protein